MPTALRSVLIPILLLPGVAAGCGETDEPSPDEGVVEAPSSVERHCFRNESPFPDDPETADVLELMVVVEGEEVSGTYRWLPAYKDQRVGRLQGTLREGVIEAGYRFEQEGAEDSVSLTIAMEADGATVRGGPPELGLDAEIGRVACPDRTAMVEEVGALSDAEVADVQEAAFRHLLRNRSPETVGKPAAVLCLRQGEERLSPAMKASRRIRPLDLERLVGPPMHPVVDLPSSFLERFAGHAPPVVPGSQCDPPEGGTRSRWTDRETGRPAIQYVVSTPERLPGGAVILALEYRVGALHGGGEMCVASEAGGDWEISRCRVTWLS